jgi:hypothetical protein
VANAFLGKEDHQTRKRSESGEKTQTMRRIIRALEWYPPTLRRAKEREGFIALFRREEDFEAAIRGSLVNTKLGPHERKPSWEGEDVFSVCDVLPFPKFLTEATPPAASRVGWSFDLPLPVWNPSLQPSCPEGVRTPPSGTRGNEQTCGQSPWP